MKTAGSRQWMVATDSGAYQVTASTAAKALARHRRAHPKDDPLMVCLLAAVVSPTAGDGPVIRVVVVRNKPAK